MAKTTTTEVTTEVEETPTPETPDVNITIETPEPTPSDQRSEPSASDNERLIEIVRTAMLSQAEAFDQRMDAILSKVDQTVSLLTALAPELQATITAMQSALGDVDQRTDQMGLITQALAEIAEQLNPTPDQTA